MVRADTAALSIGLTLGLALASLPAGSAFADPQEQHAQQPALADASSLPTNASDLFRSDADSDDIDARYHQERMTIPVTINGAGPFPFLIDTGSEATVVSTQLATQLGLRRTGETRLIGTISTKGVDTVRLGRLSVGRQTIEDLPAVLLDATHLGAAGILGIETLRDHRVIFDFTNDSITIAPSGRIQSSNEFEIVVKAKRKQDRMVISNAEIDGVPVNIVIDTGSNMSIGNSALRKSLSKNALLGSAGIMDVTGAQLDTDIVKVETMQIGSLRLEKSYLLINDSPAFAELGLSRRPAVLLGMNHLRAFDRISVDFSRREIAFDLLD